MCRLRNGATKKELELARHFPPQLFPRAILVIPKTLHLIMPLPPAAPTKKKKAKKKANSPKSLKAWVVLTHEIVFFFWKKTPEVTLTRDQSKERCHSKS